MSVVQKFWLGLTYTVAVAKNAAVFVLKVLPEGIQNEFKVHSLRSLCFSVVSNHKNTSAFKVWDYSKKCILHATANLMSLIH